jgi:pimeloyl-ACP methyl ester carboxylesterase
MTKKLAPLFGVIAVLFFAISARAADFTFDSAGVKIHYIVEGQGEPVVLIHGYAASIAANWAQPGVIKALATNYQVIALDNRGHGQSDKPHDQSAYGTKTLDDVIRLMDHLKIKKAHIVGYSMGGFMTEELMVEHPNRFLTATFGGAGWNDPKDTTMATSLNQLADSLETGKGIGPLIIALNPVGAPLPSPQQLEMTNKMFMAANDAAALAAVARGFAKFPPIPEAKIRGNKIPALALIGELDPLKAGVDHLNGVMPHLKIVVIPGATHLTAFANPLFISSLKGFLAEHPSKERARAVPTGF